MHFFAVLGIVNRTLHQVIQSLAGHFADCQRESTPEICDSGAMVRDARIEVPTSAPVVMSPLMTR